MTEILAENLSEKEVVGSNGKDLGTLYNITMDLKTGTLRYVKIDPTEGADVSGFEQDEYGRLMIPVNRVQAVTDKIIISR